MLARQEIFTAASRAELSCFSLFPHLNPKLNCLSTDGGIFGHVAGADEVDDDDDNDGLMTVMMVRPVLNSQLSKYLHSRLSSLLSQLLSHHCSECITLVNPPSSS